MYYFCTYIGVADTLTQIIGAGAVILARILAVKYHWGLPRLKGEEAE